MNLKSMTAAQIEDAWQTEQGLAHPAKAFTMREVPLSQLEERKAVKRVVQRAICSSAESLAKYEDDYREIFLEDPTYRVLAAYSNGALAGGMAIKLVPDDKEPKGAYVEFLGTKRNAHVGKPMVVQLKQWVKVHPKLEFIALNSLDPSTLKKESPHVVHTCTFWTERGFAQLDALSLGRLTLAVEPSRGALRRAGGGGHDPRHALGAEQAARGLVAPRRRRPRRRLLGATAPAHPCGWPSGQPAGLSSRHLP